MLKLTQYGPLLWIVSSETSETIAKTFIRFQEFYENPIYRGVQGFTVEQIERWWNTKNSEESYYKAWSGFNIPGRIVREVLSIESFYPLTELEKQFVDLLEPIPLNVISNSAILGIGDNTDDVILHELAHGFWATDCEYRKQQESNIANLDPEIFSSMSETLKEMGYNASVVIDELHAYLSTYPSDIKNNFAEPLIYKILQATTPFAITFNRFYQRSLNEKLA